MVRITHYLYNTFLIETEDSVLAIDPGTVFFHYFRLKTLLPKREWKRVSHVLITHGDPDHYWYADKVATAGNATVIMNSSMIRTEDGRRLALGPRSKGLSFDTEFDKLLGLEPGRTVQSDGMLFTGLKATHGPLTIDLGPISKTVHPGPEERVGWGALGFDIMLQGKRIVNLGDTVLEKEAWAEVRRPDLLMLPIGGQNAGNVMTPEEALTAVEEIRPKTVIPTHFNMPALLSSRYGPADGETFKEAVEAMGIACVLLRKNESHIIKEERCIN